MLVSALLLLPLALRALDPGKSIYQFNCQNWTRQGGLPADKINDIVQTSDGYIWLGTQHGLVRFDGREFTATEIDFPPAQGEDVKKLHRASGGGLWFANNEGNYGGFDGKKFRAVGDERWARFGLQPSTILETRAGAVWTGAGLGFGRWVPGKPGETFFSGETILGVLSLAEDATGRVWLGTAEHGLHYWADGKMVQVSDDGLKGKLIFALAAEADGRMWVGTQWGLRCYSAEGKTLPAPGIESEIKALLVDSHGVLWIGTSGKGLARYQDGMLTYLRKADGLGSDYILSLFEGAEGTLWIGTQNGLSQLSDLKFPIVSAKDGILAGSTHWVAPAADGGLWIATPVGLSHYDGRESKNLTYTTFPANQWLRAVFEARNGDLVVSDGLRNIAILTGDKVTALYPNAGWPNAFAEDATSVLATVNGELYRIGPGGLQPYEYQAGQKVATTWIHNLCVAQDGAIWLACDGKIARLKDGVTQQWPFTDDRIGNKAYWIFEDVDGAIWAGLSAGIARIKGGELRHLTGNNDLTVDPVFAIVPDNLGFFWISSTKGISRVSRQNLNDLVDGRPARFEVDRFNGLESIKFSDRTDQGFSGAKTLDGRIWFPNPQGVVMIDPAHFFTNPVPPPVHIQAVWVDGVELPDRTAAVLKPASKRIAFSFVALSYIAPTKIAVRYQLEGFDAAWIDAEGRRAVLYANLPAGHYRFRVQAANADGIWNTAGDEFGLELLPPYYQTGWFYGLVALAAGLSVMAAYFATRRHQRISQLNLQRENNLLEAKVAERTAELSGSLSLLNATLESTTDGILAVNLAGEVISYNSKFIAIWQFPPELLSRRAAAEMRAYAASQLKDPDVFLNLTAGWAPTRPTGRFDVIELKDGRIFERYAFPQLIDGRTVGTVVNWRDVTTRKRTEQVLQRQQTELRALFDLMPAMIWFKDTANRHIRVNQRVADAAGKTIAEIEGKSAHEIYPLEAEKFYGDDLEVIHSGLPKLGYVETLRSPEGKELWVQTDKVPVRDENGKVIGIIVMAQDITERRQADESLRLLSSAVEQSRESIIVTDAQLDLPGPRIVFLNSAYTKMTGFTAAEALGKTPRITQGPKTDRTVLDRLRRNLTAGEAFEGITVNYRKDGTEFILEWQVAPIRNAGGTITHFIAIQHDITARMRAEEESRRNTALLEAQVESYAVGVVMVDNEGRKILQNRRLVDLWKIPPEIAGGSDDRAQVAWIVGRTRQPERFVQKVTHLYAHPEESSADEIELLDGTVLDRHSAPVIGKDGRNYGRIWTFADITARKQAERLVRQSEERLRSLIDNARDAIFTIADDATFTSLNPAVESITGLTRDQWLGQPFAPMVHPDDLPVAREMFQRIMRGEQAPVHELRGNPALGINALIEMTLTPQKDETGRIIGLLGIGRDITERKKAEAELKQVHGQLLDASRQAGMAEVATGVLHNVGNVLNSVNVSATLVADNIRHSKAANLARVCALLDQHKADLGAFITTDPKGLIIPSYLSNLAASLAAERVAVIAELESLRKNIDHIKDIVAMQQNYAKNSGFTETISLPDLIEDTLRMNAGSLARHDIDLVRDYQARPVLTLDKHKVMQILVNLIRNAKYACDESGRTDKRITLRVTTDEHCIRIAVSDNGVGIPAENLTRIFNHGFTTREHGHGFGLHSCALAAKQLGGALSAHSEGAGHGATFTLELPSRSRGEDIIS